MAVLGATNLTGCNSIPDFIAGGSLVLFQQTTAPTSWTKQTTHNNKALRVVSGTATPGGSTAFTTVFASRPVSGTVGNHTLTTPQIPSHNHPNGSEYVNVTSVGNPSPSHGANPQQLQERLAVVTTGNTGGDGVHAHPFSATALGLCSSICGCNHLL
jgi:hypothetical protein